MRCVQSFITQYSYMRPIHDVGEYLMLGCGVVWAWINVVLSFRTHPQLSSLFVCWLRVFLIFTTTVAIIVYAVIPVFSRYFLDDCSLP